MSRRRKTRPLPEPVAPVVPYKAQGWRRRPRTRAQQVERAEQARWWRQRDNAAKRGER